MKKFAKLFMAAVLASSILVGCGKSYSTLEEYFNDHAEELAEAEEAGGCKCEVKDNTLTYIYSYDEDYDDDAIAIMAESIEEGLAANESELVSARDLISKSTGIDDVVTVYRYVDADGTVIYEAQY